jgi:hypothetical protein
MPDLRTPQLDDWLDEEISSLLEPVEADPGGAPMPQEATPALPARPASRGRLAQMLRVRGAHVLRLSRTLGRRLVYSAAALGLAAFIGWLVTQLTP